MAQIALHDPLRTYAFKLYFADDNTPIAGVSKMGALKQKIEDIAWKDGGHPHNSQSHLPGGASFETVAFEQGLGLDDGRFEDWALAASDWKNGPGAYQPAKFRRTLRVELLNRSGVMGETVAGRKINYILEGAWVSEYQALPELDANSLNTIGIASITVSMEGWHRQQ